MDNIAITNIRSAVASHSSSSSSPPPDLERSQQGTASSDAEGLNGREGRKEVVNRHPQGKLSAAISGGAKNSKDLKGKTTDEWSQRQSVSTSSADVVEMPSSLPKVEAEKCCLCFGPAAHDQIDEKIKLTKNLCLVMTTNQDDEDILEENSNVVVSFCVDCKSRVKTLWEVEQTIQLAQIRKLEIVSGIEKVAWEGELLTPGLKTRTTDTSNGNVSKIRKSIIESKYCRKVNLNQR